MNAGASALPLRRPDDRFDRGSSARHRGQLTKVEPVRVFALVIAVDRREGDAERKPPIAVPQRHDARSEEHTSELQSLMRISYAVFCLKKKNKNHNKQYTTSTEHITPRYKV